MKQGLRSWMWLGLGLAVVACGEGQDVGDEADVIASAARKAEAKPSAKAEAVAGEVVAEVPENVGDVSPFEGELLCPRGGNTGPVRVSFACDAITVETCKDLSNLVIGLSDGTRVRHEGQSGHLNTFEIPEAASVVSVWVKAGANHSGEGPGYGERVDAPEGWCIEQPAPIPTPVESEEPSDGEEPVVV